MLNLSASTAQGLVADLFADLALEGVTELWHRVRGDIAEFDFGKAGSALKQTDENSVQGAAEMGNIKSTDTGENPGRFNALNSSDNIYKNSNSPQDEVNKLWFDKTIRQGDDVDFIRGMEGATKTLPQNIPDPNAVSKGRKTKISSKDNLETIRSLTRENESADILAKIGYDVEQNPKVDGPKNPDYKINGKVFDNYSPGANKSPRGIMSKIEDKIISGQTERIVLNLSDWKGNINDLIKQIKDWPIKGLKEIIAIDKDGNIFHLYP